MSDCDQTMIGLRQGWGGTQIPFGIKTADHRRHVYVIGKTGSGKTTLQRNSLIQLIEAGHGVAFIDPHGDDAEDLLNHIPSSRSRHVVYFNPSDLEYPIGINLLANVPPDARHLVASGIIAAFKSIWRESWGPRMEYILYNALAALLDCENATLLGVTRLLTDSAFRASVVRQIRDPLVKNFWQDEYENYDDRFRREAISPIQNKIGQFLMNPPIRNILGQVKSKIDFRFMMDDQRIFIANLSKGKLGEDKANLLGALLTTQFQLAAMSRSDIPERERKDFFLFIDEFQNFTTDAFASILSEARKYRLCLTISHQYIDQLPLEIRQAVFGNVGTIISFCVGSSDAEVLEGEFGDSYRSAQFTDLNRFEILVKLLEDGISSVPFRAFTSPPLAPPHFGRDNLIARSRERYSTTRQFVEEKINRWIAPRAGSSKHLFAKRC